jgi:hypothetical protein
MSLVLLILALLAALPANATFDIVTSVSGTPLNQHVCNIQTNLNFEFSSSSSITPGGTTVHHPPYRHHWAAATSNS